MSNIKGKGQRLIPEDLLKYLEAYKENHPDPTAGGGANLDDIVDSHGNKRFVEGDGTPKTVSGLTSSFCKWSLSGTHLMVVFAGSINSGTTISGTRIAEYTIPSFIYNKIYPTFGDVIEIKTLNAYPDSGSSPQGGGVWFYKKNDIIYLYYNDSTTFTGSTRYFRIQFDLLIDSDYE